MYEIRTYREEFLDDQVSIGSRIYDKWRMGGQTRRPQLEKAYRAEGFDPGTRLYGFRDGVMQGFMSQSSAAMWRSSGLFFPTGSFPSLSRDLTRICF